MTVVRTADSRLHGPEWDRLLLLHNSEPERLSAQPTVDWMPRILGVDRFAGVDLVGA